MNIIVAGGTGFVGKRIVNSFVENGFNVCVLTRNATKHRQLCRQPLWKDQRGEKSDSSEEQRN